MDKPVRSWRDYLKLVVKGMAMGAADVVPGVSGGTIAFITGIYDELLHSLQNLTPAVLVMLKRNGLKATWKHINGNFLVCVFFGILLSIKTLAGVIGAALQAYPVLVWAFFFGLILASILYFARLQTNWRWPQWLACLAGAAFVYGVSVATPAQLPGHWWILFLGGFVAICAMILPGISGSFILLLVGLYPAVLAAINDLDLLALASIGLGCICGLLVFSRLLAWLLDNFHKTTLAVLIGFLIGSLNVTWPWKHTVETTLDRHGELIPLVQKPVFPGDFQSLTGAEPMLGLALLSAFFGFILVLITEYISGGFKSKD